jgi:serine/threonine protein kinase
LSTSLPATIGPYQIRGKLGAGAFGVVYKGHDPKLARDVAIKILRPESIGSDKHVQRFLREARVVAQMHHEHIVPIFQFEEYEGGYFFASKFIPGQPLAAAIPEKGLEAARAVDILLQLLEALTYAHSQKPPVLHRDVKPDNAMLDDEGKLWLMDFGLAGWVGSAEGRLTRDGGVMGTPSYMPPEQARGNLRLVGPASDQYSAGVVLYELLTGSVPFEGPAEVILHNVKSEPPPSPSQWRPDLDRGLEAICLRALAKNPRDRFADCRAFADALRAWQTSQREPTIPPLKPPAESWATVGVSLIEPEFAVGSPAPVPDGVECFPVSLIESEFAVGSSPDQPALKPPRRWWLLVVVGIVMVAVLTVGGYGVLRLVKSDKISGAGGYREKINNK